MADDDHRAVEALEPGFQPDQRVQVQVVGRLVQQQQVGRAHQRARQLQPHAPAAGEAVDRRVELLAAEAQAQQQRLRARARVEGAGLVQRQVRVGHGMAVAAGFGGGQRGLRALQRQVALQHEVGGAVLGLGHVLRHLADAPARRDLDVAGVGMQPVGEQREQAGLAGAVAADQADLLARLQRHVGALQHDLGAAAQRQVAQRDHASASAASSSTWSSPALVGSQSGCSCGKAASKCGALVADLQHQRALRLQVLRRRRPAGGG